MRKMYWIVCAFLRDHDSARRLEMFGFHTQRGDANNIKMADVVL
jgi:hypothetical protein